MKLTTIHLIRAQVPNAVITERGSGTHIIVDTVEDAVMVELIVLTQGV